MKFINRNGELVNIDFQTDDEFNKPVLAQSGRGQSFVTNSTKDLKNLSKKEGEAILSNTKYKMVLSDNHRK